MVLSRNTKGADRLKKSSSENDINKILSKCTEKIQEVNKLGKNIKYNIEGARSLVDRLAGLDQHSKEKCHRRLTEIEKQTNTNLLEVREKIFARFTTNPGGSKASDSLEEALLDSAKLLKFLESKDIGAIRADLSPVFKIARRNFWEYPPVMKGELEKLSSDINAIEEFAKILNDRGALIADFDSTLVDPREQIEQLKMPVDFIKSAGTYVKAGIPVAIITARPIEMIIEALKNGGAEQDLIDKLDIYGEDSVTHRGPNTERESIVRDKRAEKYCDLAKKVINTIKEKIKEDKDLNELANQGCVGVTEKTLGGTVQGKRFGIKLKDHLEELAKSENINVEEKKRAIVDKLKAIVSKVLDEKRDYKVFRQEDLGMIGISISLNEHTTGIKIDKGGGVADLIERLKLKGAVICGDDIPDLAMEKMARLLVAANKFIDGYMSEPGRKNKIEIFKGFISGLQVRFKIEMTEDEIRLMAQRHKMELTDDQIEEMAREHQMELTEGEKDAMAKGHKVELIDDQIEVIASAKVELHKELLSLLPLERNTMNTQVFVGVKDPNVDVKDSEAIRKRLKMESASTFMVDGATHTVAFMGEIVNKISEMKKANYESKEAADELK